MFQLWMLVHSEEAWTKNRILFHNLWTVKSSAPQLVRRRQKNQMLNRAEELVGDAQRSSQHQSYGVPTTNAEGSSGQKSMTHKAKYLLM